jgi:hypothetical protein
MLLLADILTAHGVQQYIRGVGKAISQAKILAIKYRKLTGRPLGITGEVAEYEAMRLLDLQLAPVRQPGFDAIYSADGSNRKVQIKGRCILETSKPGQRVPSIKLTHSWDSVILVLLNEKFEPTDIFEAYRPDIKRELERPGSKSRNERGAMSLSKFKAISHQLWPRS